MTDTHNTKVCSKCGQKKTLDCFHIKPKGKFGVHSICKICRCIQSTEYTKRNAEKNRIYQKNYKQKIRLTTDGRKKLSAINSKYAKNNKEKVNAYYSNRRKNDSLFLIKARCRGFITKAFDRNGYTKRSKTSEIIGCSWENLKLHIESQFVNGMCWERRNEIHIDHIIPLATAKTEEDVIRLNHYTNLQPLWAADNIRKSDKLDHPLCA